MAVAPSNLRIPSWAACHPDNSPFHLMNDAAYSLACTSRQYNGRTARRNHAAYRLGVNSAGVCNALFMHFYRAAEEGQEVFAEYGWAYWRDYVAALERPLLPPPPTTGPGGVEAPPIAGADELASPSQPLTRLHSRSTAQPIGLTLDDGP